MASSITDTSADFSGDSSQAGLGVASIVAISLLSVALVAALQAPLPIDESGFEASITAEHA